MALTGSLSADDAAQQLADAVDFGQIAAQHAPAGDPIFAAIDDAQETREFVAEYSDTIGTVLTPGSRTYARIDEAIDAIYSAAAELRNDPAAPLPRTLWTLPVPAAPWQWIGVAGGVLFVGFMLFKHRRRGRTT